MNQFKKALHQFRIILLFAGIMTILGSCARGISNKKVGKLESELEAKQALSKIIENYPSLKEFGDSTSYRIKINDQVEFRSGDDFRTEIEISALLQGKVSKDTIEKVNKLIEKGGDFKANLKTEKGNDIVFEKKGYDYKIDMGINAEGKTQVEIVKVEPVEPEPLSWGQQTWNNIKGFFASFGNWLKWSFWLIILLIIAMITYKTFFSK